MRNLARDESGQGTVEYVLILSTMAIGTIKFAQAMLAVLDRGILNLGGQLEKDLKTGRANIAIWKN